MSSDAHPLFLLCIRRTANLPSQVCSALPANSTGQAGQLLPESVGVCTTPTLGLLLPDTVPAPWPQPLAYFPLTNGSLASWPDAGFNGIGSNLTWNLDSRFGAVMTCDKVGTGPK